MSNLTLPQQFCGTIDKFNMLSGQKGVLLGYSGGADSTALLHLLADCCRRLGLYFHAVHVNHGIRGEEADRDAEFCKRECKKLSVDFTLLKVDIPKLSKENGRGLEEEAREYRYRAFARIINENPRLTCIATAHNADDSAETVLFNLSRGSGISGLCGIPPVREFEKIKIIRPLIYSSKKDICGYCEENGIEYIFDSTNNDTLYTRNYIRHELIPKFVQINPNFINTVVRNGDMLRRDFEYLEKEAQEFLGLNATDMGIDISALLNVHEAIASRAVVFQFSRCSQGMLEKVHIDALLDLVKNSGNGAELSLPDKVRARIDGGRLVFEKAINGGADDGVKHFYFELKNGVNKFVSPDFAVVLSKKGEMTKDLQKDNETLQNIYKLSIHTSINSDRIKKVLFVRSRMDGDSYVYGNMTRRIKKLYNDRGYSKKYRAKNPIFCDSQGIIWVPGFPPASRVTGGEDLDIVYYFN